MIISKLRLAKTIQEFLDGSIASVDASAGTTAIPCRIGTAAAPTGNGELYLNSSTLALTMGNGTVAVPIADLTNGLGILVTSGTGTAPSDAGALYYNSSTGRLTMGIGAAAVPVGETLNFARPTAYLGNGDVINLTFTGEVAAGSPVIAGEISGVAAKLLEANVAGPVFVKGQFTLSVKGVDGSGNSAVVVGDKLYYTEADTPKISKKTTGTFFGYATKAVNSGATDAAATVLLK